MPRQAPKDGQNRFKRYRDNKRRAGMRLLRMWVPDTNAPGFAEEMKRQAQNINAGADEAAAMDFIEQAFDWDSLL